MAANLLSARVAHMHSRNEKCFYGSAAMFASYRKFNCLEIQSYRAILGILNEMFAFFIVVFLTLL